MSDIAVRTIGLGKMYRIGGERQKFRTLRDTLVQTAKRPIERIRHPGAATHVSQTLWALRDVDLEVMHGEAIGVIGRNGAGKSTLLKVLSHITEPTEGRVEINGRVGSLLEVGTGFHPELTGRENIRLNGAILGMTRAEIKRKFDEIVEFAEISRFLDTPVKRYSSGMYVRLAFAVAAYLDPEILVVDEVLSVGDAAFQKKCLGKMEDVAGGGRTVLFVSHNMSAVRALCTRCVRLSGGRLVQVGEVDDVVDEYLASGGTSGDVFGLREDLDSAAIEGVAIVGARLLGIAQEEGSKTTLEVGVDCRAAEELEFNLEWRIVTAVGEAIVFGAPEIFRHERISAPRGDFAVTLTIRNMPLAAGTYRLEIAATQAFRRVLDTVHVPFTVEACDPAGVGFDFRYQSSWAATFAEDEVRLSSWAGS
jgi:ABC-type polysaccharide/polyol phosphate transport system ATPase subunit